MKGIILNGLLKDVAKTPFKGGEKKDIRNFLLDRL